MLAALTIRDIVLFQQAGLEFGPGLNVLTGETGAGKTILLDSLGFALGRRGRAVVRKGCSQGSVTAVFELSKDHRVNGLLESHGLTAKAEIVLRRTLGSDGRSRAFVNDELVGVGLVKELGDLLLEVHGQKDDQQLFDAATHRLLLDGFGQLDATTKALAERYRALHQAREELEALKRDAKRAEQEAQYVRAATDELVAFDPKQGEEEELASERSLMMNAAKIIQDVSSALELLASETGAQINLARALKKLSRMEETARKKVAPAQSALEQAYTLIEEVRRDLEKLLSDCENDPLELERKEERLFALRALARKYSVGADELPKLRDGFIKKQQLLEGGNSFITLAEEKFASARALYLKEAKSLSQARAICARKLEDAVATELGALKLGHARLRVHLEPIEEDKAAASGLERVSFEVETLKGAGFGALARIASGGELARFSLALKVALAQCSPTPALVFDEVDQGVGGAVADAVGERLQRLARNSQVLLVTHSPQVAARAERHFRISRASNSTAIKLLDEEERQEEIARMLSGSNISEEARAAARRLIAEAGQPPSKKVRKRA